MGLILPNTNRMKPRLGARLNRDPINQGLVGCWLMHEGAGNTLNDLTGRGHNGIITNATWTAGPRGPCLYCDDDDDYATVANHTDFVFGTSDFTVAVRFCSNTPTSTNPNLISKGRASSGDWFIDTPSNTSVRFYSGYGDISASITGITAGTWYDVVFTRQTGTMYGYLNGVYRVSDTTATVNLSTVKNLRIGANIDVTDRDWKGWIDWAKIWNRAISPSEIARLYREPFAGVAQERIEMWSAVGGGAAGLSIPAAMRYYRNRRVAS